MKRFSDVEIDKMVNEAFKKVDDHFRELRRMLDECKRSRERFEKSNKHVA